MVNRPESLQRVATVVRSCYILALDVACGWNKDIRKRQKEPSIEM